VDGTEPVVEVGFMDLAQRSHRPEKLVALRSAVGGTSETRWSCGLRGSKFR